VGQVRQRPPVRLAARPKRLLGDQHGGDDAAGDEECAHDECGGGEKLLRPPDPPPRPILGVAQVTLHVGHDRDAGLEPGQAQGQFREHQQRDGDHQQRAAMLGGQGRGPVLDRSGTREYLPQPDENHDEVQNQVHADEPDGDADGLGEPLQEHRTQQREQHQRGGDVVAAQRVRPKWVLVDVCGRVGRRQSHGDEKVGSGKPEQGEHEKLALPEGQQPFKHGDRPLAARALLRNAAVHRQRPREGD
jgi:hypothetical protein